MQNFFILPPQGTTNKADNLKEKKSEGDPFIRNNILTICKHMADVGAPGCHN